jgi:hypothetical protein
MNKVIRDVSQSMQEVFSQKRYVLIALIFFLVLFLFNVLLMNFSLIWNLFSFELLWNLIIGISASRTWYSAISMIVLSFLGGIVLAMTVYLIRRQIAFNATSGSSGILISIIAPSCSACAIGILGIIGVGGAIAALPFEGLEINILALVLLFWSIIYLSKTIATVVCEVK